MYRVVVRTTSSQPHTNARRPTDHQPATATIFHYHQRHLRGPYSECARSRHHHHHRHRPCRLSIDPSKPSTERTSKQASSTADASTFHPHAATVAFGGAPTAAAAVAPFQLYHLLLYSVRPTEEYRTETTTTTMTLPPSPFPVCPSIPCPVPLACSRVGRFGPSYDDDEIRLRTILFCSGQGMHNCSSHRGLSVPWNWSGVK